MTVLAGRYDFGGGVPRINGEPVPWYVAEEGPLVESTLGGSMHILWLPILVNAPMPTPPEGRPDARPLAQPEDLS